MKRYLNQLPNEYRELLNQDLLNKSFDRPLHEYIFDSFKGFEILPNIKILGYEWVPDEDKYDVNDHVIRRNSNKNKTIKHISETRCGVMYIDVEITAPDKNGVIKVYGGQDRGGPACGEEPLRCLLAAPAGGLRLRYL